MNFGLKLAAAATAVLMTGCATIKSGTTQEITVSSHPSGATVYVGVVGRDGSMLNRTAMGVTPLTVRVSRKAGAIDVVKEGYAPVQLAMTTKMNPWVWGDILLTSPLSTSIDTSTGAANEFDPGEYSVQLQRATPPVAK